MANTQSHGIYDFSDALSLFRSGMDTADIARLFEIHESEALRLVAKQRSADLDIPSPFPGTQDRCLSVRIHRQLQPTHD